MPNEFVPRSYSVEQRKSTWAVVDDVTGETVGVFKTESTAQQLINCLDNGTTFENPEFDNYDEVWAEEIASMTAGEVL